MILKGSGLNSKPDHISGTFQLNVISLSPSFACFSSVTLLRKWILDAVPCVGTLVTLKFVKKTFLAGHLTIFEFTQVLLLMVHMVTADLDAIKMYSVRILVSTLLNSLLGLLISNLLYTSIGSGSDSQGSAITRCTRRCNAWLWDNDCQVLCGNSCMPSGAFEGKED